MTSGSSPTVEGGLIERVILEPFLTVGLLPRPLPDLLGRIPEHREEVTGGAGNHKKMPGKMAIAN